MNCPKCNSEKTYKNGKEKHSGKQKYFCRECKYNFTEDTKRQSLSEPKINVGTPIDEWRKKYDVDYIVEKVMNELDKNIIYEKQDIVRLSGLSASYPGLSAAIESYTEYYGKVGGKHHFSHPDTINHYKSKGRLS